MPYLEADLAASHLTLADGQAWLNLLWLKFNEIVLLRSSHSARYFAGFPIGFNIALGGQLVDGSDATNLLSYMCLRAQADLGLTQPNLSVRVHEGSPEELLEAAAEEYECELVSFEVREGTVAFSFDSDELTARMLKILRNGGDDES